MHLAGREIDGLHAWILQIDLSRKVVGSNVLLVLCGALAHIASEQMTLLAWRRPSQGKMSVIFVGVFDAQFDESDQ